MSVMRWISALLLLAVLVNSYAASIPQDYTLIKGINVEVPANTEWTNSTVYATTGDYIIMMANGTWRYDPRPQFEVGPNGLTNTVFGIPLGKLIGRIDDGGLFEIGTYWEGYAPADGWLYIGMYDTTPRENNAGSLIVNVQVYRKTTESEKEEKTPEKPANISTTVKQKEERLTGANNAQKAICGLIPLLLVIFMLAFFVVKHTESMA